MLEWNRLAAGDVSQAECIGLGGRDGGMLSASSSARAEALQQLRRPAEAETA
jgi:hypothetical protein